MCVPGREGDVCARKGGRCVYPEGRVFDTNPSLYKSSGDCQTRITVRSPGETSGTRSPLTRATTRHGRDRVVRGTNKKG